MTKLFIYNQSISYHIYRSIAILEICVLCKTSFAENAMSPQSVDWTAATVIEMLFMLYLTDISDAVYVVSD